MSDAKTLVDALEKIANKEGLSPKSIHDAQVIRYSQWAIDIANEALQSYRAQADEPKYRMLEFGERIQEGDEHDMSLIDGWKPARHSIGGSVNEWGVNHYRRPITTEGTR